MKYEVMILQTHSMLVEVDAPDIETAKEWAREQFALGNYYSPNVIKHNPPRTKVDYAAPKRTEKILRCEGPEEDRPPWI